MSLAQEFNCVLCDESFENKEELHIHFRKHGDPMFSKKISNKGTLSSELPKEGKSGNEGELVSCEVCSETFTLISKAITHKHRVHPDHDAKYFCPWCGKLFTMKHLYNKHIEASHSDKEATDSTFHCDVCSIDFFIPSAMLYHNKFYHRQDTEAVTIGRSTKMKAFLQEFIKISYCPFCGEEYVNDVNLNKHLTDEHSEENQSPEEVLRCPLCDAIFYHLDAYELHLTFHSTEDLYTDKNELAEKVTEFSLESVSPITEKVNGEPEAFETAGSFIEVESFLQQAMNESIDNNDSSNSELIGKKHKKHKKHKKSKSKSKETITLDEFLNMNNVFGDGMDFQGIEEVPSQAVTKRLKKRPVKAKMNSATSSDVQKLKKMGIVVNTKSGNSILGLKGAKIATATPVAKLKLPTKAKQPMGHVKTTPVNTSTDMLSKLLNQNNSQLKIVKKSAVENDNRNNTGSSEENIERQSTAPEEKIDRTEGEHENSQESKPAYPANVDIDNTKKHLVADSVPGDSDSLDNSKQKDKYFDNDPNSHGKDEFHSTYENDYERPNCADENYISDEGIKSPIQDALDVKNKDPNSDVLRNLGQSCTIKSVPAIKSTKTPITTQASNENNSDEDDGHPNNDNNIKTKLRNILPVTRSNILRNVSQHLTVKSIPTSNKQILKESENETNINEKEDSGRETPENSNATKKIKPYPAKSSNIVHNLSPHLTIKPITTVKSPKFTSITDEQKQSHSEEEEEEHLNYPETEVNKNKSVKLETKKTDVRNTSPNVLHNISQHLTIKSVSNSADDSQLPKIQNEDKDDCSNYDHSSEDDDHNEPKTTASSNNNKDVFNPLNRLSSLITVKPVNKGNVEIEKKYVAEANSETEFDESGYSECEDVEDNNSVSKKYVTKTKLSNPKPIDPLKGLNKNLTIKSLSQSNKKTDTQNKNYDNSNKISNPAGTNIITQNLLNSKIHKSLPSTSVKQAKLVNTSNRLINESNAGIATNSTQIHSNAAAILKSLPNVTAKSVSKCSQQTTIKSSVQSTNNFVQKTFQKQERVEESEIFNIDDSDDEEANSQDSSHLNTNVTQAKQCGNTPKPSINKLRNYVRNQCQSKNPNQNNSNVNIPNNASDNSDDDFWPNDIDITNNLKGKKIQQAYMQDYNKHKAATNVGKKISKPKIAPKSEQNNKMLHGFDTDSDNSNQGVKITEMNSDDNLSDDDTPLNQLTSNRIPKNAIVESPHDSNSESEAFDYDDIEATIKTNLVTKPVYKDKPKVDKNYECLKNLGKNITIKSNSKEPEPSSEEKDVHSDDELPQNEHVNVPNFGANLTIKSLKPSISKPMPLSKKAKLLNDHTMNQQMSQIDSVNKEVTVQTFQTRTVVQEITTTVTKTIRTVNQSVQQESRNISQINQPKVRPQKNQGFKQGQPTMYQGIPVRPPGPSVGSKVRPGAIAKQNPVRNTSGQLVPIRPGCSLIRPNKTQTSSPRKSAPSTSNYPMTGKLKIAPNALVPLQKRPPTDEPSGPFSCFKKPKESIILSSDIPQFPTADESSFCGSSSTMSKSNVTITSKVVKGNSVVTSTQMKSKMSASTQQIGKLNNLSGLKITKTSQCAPAQDERNDDNGHKRTTLEGIEKLQRLGLLVKKPRLDFDEDASEHSGEEFDDMDT